MTDIKELTRRTKNDIDASIRELARAIPFTDVNKYGYVVLHIGSAAFKKVFSGVRMYGFRDDKAVNGAEAHTKTPDDAQYVDKDGIPYADCAEVDRVLGYDALTQDLAPKFDLRDGVEDDGTKDALDALIKYSADWVITE